MQFIYHQNAGNFELQIQGELYQHLYKSRRTRHTQILHFRNFEDDYLYAYEQKLIDKRSALLQLKDKTLLPNIPKSKTHLILAMIEFKALQKILPFLNELGVEKLTIFYADFSQKNEKFDFEKAQKILINSSQQCGRSNIVKLEVLQSLAEVLHHYPKIAIFDFGGEAIREHINLPLLIGPEGGFSPKEKESLKHFPIYSTQENIILKSQTACIYLASLCLKT